MTIVLPDLAYEIVDRFIHILMTAVVLNIKYNCKCLNAKEHNFFDHNMHVLYSYHILDLAQQVLGERGYLILVKCTFNNM